MPNIENQIDIIQQNTSVNTTNETAYFTKLDLKYVYSQLIFDSETPLPSRPYKFNIISGECAGTYCFITGYYGLTNMPAAF